METIAVNIEGEEIHFRRTVETEPSANTNRAALSIGRDDDLDH